MEDLDRIRVLVVDDDHDTLMLLGMFLRKQRAVVETAGSAAEALEVMKSFQPDVIVSDIGMPEMDGYEFMRTVRIREEHATPATAIALTGQRAADGEQRALLAGYNVFMGKPFKPVELCAAIKRATRTPSS